MTATASGPKQRFTLGPRARFILGVILVLAFVASIGWIVLGWPLALRVWVALALVAFAAATAFIGLFMKDDLPAQWKRALAGGSALILGIAAVMAVPAIQTTANPPTSPSTPLAPRTTTSSTAASDATPSDSPARADEPDPLAVTLELKELSCENYTIPKSFLSSLPKIATGYDAEWIYKNGGATLSHAAIYVQGKSQDAVIIQRIRVIDVQKHAPPPDVIGVFSCGPEGGAVATRRLEVNMDHPTKVRSVPGEIDPDGTRQPAYKFPFKVSNSEPEVFLIGVTGSPCFCEWRIAIDWTSAGRTGTTVVNRNFGSIRSDTSDYKDRQMYYLYDGEWMQTS